MLLERPRRRAPYGFAAPHHFGSEDAAARAQHGAGFNAGLVADPHLPADDGVVFHHHAARKTGLRRHHHVAADAAVVAHMHHVVELGSLTDGSDSQRGAVHAGIGADLDIIANLHAAHLRKLLPAVLLHHIAKTIGADYRTGMQNGAPADVHVVVDGDVRVQHAAFAQVDPLAYHRAGADRRGEADARAISHHRMRPDIEIG